MSTRLKVGGLRGLSRRGFMLSLIGATAATTSAALVSNSAWAQTAAVWRDYRRDDLGYRIEFPGEPTITDEEDETKDIVVRSTDAKVTVGQLIVGVHWMEYKGVLSAERQFSLQSEGMRLGDMATTREVPMTLNGFPVRDFIREADDINYIERLVVMEKWTIGVGAHGGRAMHSDPMVRRFFDSFQLLRAAR